MPDTGDDTATVTTYPPNAVYETWKAHADELDQSISKFIVNMVEAGRKQIQMDDVATSSVQDLRRQRDDLQREVKRERKRVRELERQLHHSATAEINTFVTNNPGATTPEIIQHVADTVPVRAVSYLDLLEGDTLQHREDGYYPLDSAVDEGQSDETAEAAQESNNE